MKTCHLQDAYEVAQHSYWPSLIHFFKLHHEKLEADESEV